MSATCGPKRTGGGRIRPMRTSARSFMPPHNRIIFCLKLRIFKSKFASLFPIFLFFSKEELNSVDFFLFSAAQFDQMSEQYTLRAPCSYYTLYCQTIYACSSCIGLMLNADVRRGGEGVGPMRTKADKGGGVKNRVFLLTSFMDDPIASTATVNN